MRHRLGLGAFNEKRKYALQCYLTHLAEQVMATLRVPALDHFLRDSWESASEQGSQATHAESLAGTQVTAGTLSSDFAVVQPEVSEATVAQPDTGCPAGLQSATAGADTAQVLPAQAPTVVQAVQSTSVPPPAAPHVSGDGTCVDATEPVVDDAGLDAVKHQCNDCQAEAGCPPDQPNPELVVLRPASSSGLAEHAPSPAPQPVPPQLPAQPLAAQPATTEPATAQPQVATQARHPGVAAGAVAGVGAALSALSGFTSSALSGMCSHRRRSQGPHHEHSRGPTMAQWSGLSCRRRRTP